MKSLLNLYTIDRQINFFTNFTHRQQIKNEISEKKDGLFYFVHYYKRFRKFGIVFGSVLDDMGSKGDIIIYQTNDGLTKVDVKFENETVWLTQEQMSELFQRDKSVISRHIHNVYDEGELRPELTVAKFATVVNRGFRGEVTEELDYYNLDVIISIGYRVKSIRGTQFRQWATGRLREYMIKGFALDDPTKKDNSNN